MALLIEVLYIHREVYLLFEKYFFDRPEGGSRPPLQEAGYGGEALSLMMIAVGKAGIIREMCKFCTSG